MSAGPTSVAATALARGTVLSDLGRYAEAVPLLGQAAALEPSSRAYCLLGRAQLGAADHAAALDAALRASALDPDAEWPHRIAAYALLGLRRGEEAVAAGQAAVRAAPQLWQTHACLAEAASTQSQLRILAMQAAEEAVRLAPDESGSHSAMRVVAGALGLDDRLAAACRRVLELDPDDAAARNDLAALALGRGRDREAMEGLLASTAADPADPVYRANLELTFWNWLRRFAAVLLWALWGVLLVLPDRDLGGGAPVWIRALLLGATGLLVAGGVVLARRLPAAGRPVLRRVMLRKPLVLLCLALLGAALLLLAGAGVAPARALQPMLAFSFLSSFVAFLGLWAAVRRASGRARRVAREG